MQLMSIWTCGPEDGNRLGRPHTFDGPDKLPIPNDLTIVQIAIGWKHGHFFTDTNDFYSWGTGTSWRLGTGDRINLPTPHKVNTFPPNTKFKQVACGDKFSAVTTQSGQLIVWGSGYAHSPTQLELPCPAETIACGQITLLVALADGSVLQFYRHMPSVRRRFDDERIISVACGANHKLALAESGKVFSWGTSLATGQGGSELPRVINAFADIQICAIFAYSNSSFFIDSQYQVWCCGTNSSGSLGLGHTDEVSVPIPQGFNFNNEQIVQIACGDDFTLYLTANGNVWASGNGGDNRNATGSSETRQIPVQATSLEGKYITQIAAGCFNSAFLENGCPPFNHLMQFRGNFADYPVSRLPYRATIFDRINVEIDPSQELIEAFGYLINDIIIYEGNQKAKIIGVTKNQIAVICEETNQICLLTENDKDQIIAKHLLISREGCDLLIEDSELGYPISVVTNPFATLQIGGFLPGDVVAENGKEFIVVGARNGKIWCRSSNENKLLSPHDDKSLTIIKRQGRSVKQLSTLDGDRFVIELNENHNDLIFSEKYGLGFFIGMVGSKYAYSFKFSLDFAIISEQKLPFVRKQEDDTEIEYTTLDFQTIKVHTSCKITSLLNFYCFDRVLIDNSSYGTVVGSYGDKLAVRSDRQTIGSGLIELIDPSKLKLIARVNIDGYLTVNQMIFNVNSSLFLNSRFLPGDRIETPDKKRGVVLGVCENDHQIYVAFDDSKNSPCLLPVDANPIASFLEMDVKQKYGDEELDISLMHCAMLRMKPGDKITTIDKKDAVFLGLGKSNYLWFRYLDDDEMCNLDFSQINPDSFVFEVF